MTNHIHDTLTLRFCTEFPAARRSGFMAMVRDLLGGDQAGLPARLIPDAYIIDAIETVVVVYEAEVGHAIPAAKMEQYARIAWHLDDMRWSMVLVRERGDRFRYAYDMVNYDIARMSGSRYTPESHGVPESINGVPYSEHAAMIDAVPQDTINAVQRRRFRAPRTQPVTVSAQ